MNFIKDYASSTHKNYESLILLKFSLRPYADGVAWSGVDFKDHLEKSPSCRVKEIGAHQRDIE